MWYYVKYTLGNTNKRCKVLLSNKFAIAVCYISRTYRSFYKNSKKKQLLNTDFCHYTWWTYSFYFIGRKKSISFLFIDDKKVIFSMDVLYKLSSFNCVKTPDCFSWWKIPSQWSNKLSIVRSFMLEMISSKYKFINRPRSPLVVGWFSFLELLARRHLCSTRDVTISYLFLVSLRNGIVRNAW